MLSPVPSDTHRYARSQAIHAEVSGILYEAFSAENGLLANVDRWTQRRVTLENLAKIELAHAAGDAVEYCYQNLIREIDSEARTGIFLVSRTSTDRSLRTLVHDPGISGELGSAVAYMAPTLFSDELAHSNDQLDLVWVTIRARFERARVDAQVSAAALGILMQDADIAQDMTDALRSMMYAFHEHVARQRCGLPALLDEQRARELAVMVAQLETRAGDYAERVLEITSRADTQ